MNLKKYLSRGKGMSVEAKASLWYTICGIITKCMTFITLPIFTRILSTDEYGLSTIYSSTAAIVIIFVSLQLPYGSLSTAMIRYKNKRDTYLASVCGICIVLTGIYFFVCIIARKTMEMYLDLPLSLLILMGIEMFFNTVQMLWMGKERFEFRYKEVVAVTLVTSIITVIVSIVAVCNLDNKGVVKIVSNASVVIIVGFIIFLGIIHRGKTLFDKECWKFALSFNIPLIPYYLSQVIFNQSDRLMINKMCGRGDAAIYGVAYSLATILGFVINAVHNSYVPWMFQKIEKKEIKDNRAVSFWLSFGIAFMLLGVIALAPEIIKIMAGEQYMEAVWIVPPVAMSVLLLYYADLFDCIEFYYEAKWFLTVSAIVSAIINVVLNYILIPIFGFVAAAYTTLLSYLFLAAIDYIYMLVLCKKNGLDKNIYNIKALVLLLVGFCTVGFCAMALYEYFIIRYTIIIFVFVVLFIFRHKIKALIQKYKN